MDHHFSDEIVEKIKKLEKKYATMGQDMNSYLDGLLYADYLTYWDYVNLDVLLNLQQPKTPIRDEFIFICYHQITELYFKLILHAMEQIADTHKIKVEEYVVQLKRINNYFENLIHSFNIMIDGMYPEEFLKFRMSLLPASGFQSAQYRMIEMCAAPLGNLLSIKTRAEFKDSPLEEQYDHLYWKKGATELATGKKTLTLRQFELKYRAKFLQLAENYKEKNLWAVYKGMSKEDQQNKELIELLRRFDHRANVQWPLMHYRSAVRYLNREPLEIAATGGTNWQKYLPPRFQAITFYPELWSEEEKAEWGKSFDL